MVGVDIFMLKDVLVGILKLVFVVKDCYLLFFGSFIISLFLIIFISFFCDVENVYLFGDIMFEV